MRDDSEVKDGLKSKVMTVGSLLEVPRSFICPDDRELPGGSRQSREHLDSSDGEGR